jgi:hypothetical protein
LLSLVTEYKCHYLLQLIKALLDDLIDFAEFKALAPELNLIICAAEEYEAPVM